MADVIFNGSSSRRSLGMAEVTMTFDNAKGLLAVEAPEVQVTRRVYRDGEGEYLINNHPCRLKDVKDLFLGSGAGTTAYCIIEQGRVDALLQASAKTGGRSSRRRPAISRFKAKKVETLRKLEKVEENRSGCATSWPRSRSSSRPSSSRRRRPSATRSTPPGARVARRAGHAGTRRILPPT